MGSERRTKRCIYCGEEIQADAVKCRYCKEFLADDEDLPVSHHAVSRRQDKKPGPPVRPGRAGIGDPAVCALPVGNGGSAAVGDDFYGNCGPADGPAF